MLTMHVITNHWFVRGNPLAEVKTQATVLHSSAVQLTPP